MSDERTGDPTFEELLVYLRRARGFDFTGYKRTSLQRRIRKRMQVVGVAAFAEYVDYLEVHPDEFAYLFNTILINVTCFFRDPPVWEYVATEVIPQVLAARPAGGPIRVWSAGCASGEEAYTLAILLAEALGPDQFRERVKVYGTDVDADALTDARMATYPARSLEDVPAELREKYFEPAGERRVFRKELRRNVIFGRLDLIQDAPISRLDLLACRNCLMYFNAETQARVLERFQFALNDGGFLVLGKAEMLLTHGNTLTPVDLKRRIFQKTGRAVLRRAWVPAGNGNGDENGNPDGGTIPPIPQVLRLRDAAFDALPVPHVVIDAKGSLVLANQPARALFGLAASDFGRPAAEVERSLRPLDLRAAVSQAAADGRPVTLPEVPWQKGADATEYLSIQVTPLRDHAGTGPLGAAITFTPVTEHRRLREDLQRSTAELEATSEELQSSNEELETTNEELQSTNEELETTNEELQSTNEELETMNEELQSANEELQTMNAELRQQTDELNHLNTFLESILGSFRGGVVVVDRNLVVLVWNHRVEDLWGLRAEEVRDRNFLNLDIGLPVEQLKQPIRTCQAGDGAPELVVDAVNRRGKAIRCQVSCTPLRGPGKDIRGVILLMEELNGEKA